MRTKSIILALSFFALLLSSCAKEPNFNEQSKERVSLRVGTRAFIGGTSEGVTISKLRLIIFDLNGEIVLNSTSDNGKLIEDADGKYTIDIETGKYKTCIIANETAQMTEGLNSLQEEDGLKPLKILWKESQYTESNTPLVVYGELTVTKDSGGNGLGSMVTYGLNNTPSSPSTPSNPVDIEMTRAQTKISLYVRKKEGITDEVKVTKVEIMNVPEWSYIYHYQGADQAEPPLTKSATPFTNSAGVEITTNAGDITHNTTDKYHNILSTGVILPEKIMDDPSAKANATYLVIHATYKGIVTKYTVPLRADELIENYQLLRNVHYKVYVTLATQGELEITPTIVVQPQDWSTGKDIDVSLLTAFINITETEIYVFYTEGDARSTDAYVYYSTNQPSAILDKATSLFDEASGVNINVADINTYFESVAGEDAENNVISTNNGITNGILKFSFPADRVYTSTSADNTSTQFFPIHDHSGILAKFNPMRFKIIINANGLKRECHVTAILKQSSPEVHFGYIPYIGTFHRWNQTGERLIFSRHTKKWRVTVMDDPSNSSDFVRVHVDTSPDPRFYTDNPGDAESFKLPLTGDADHPLLSKGQSAEKEGNIVFRVGLTSPLSSPQASPRYARIKVEWSRDADYDEVQYIYVRQGEADDYVFSKSDPEGNLWPDPFTPSTGGLSRISAIKFSPFNLTVQRPTLGGNAFASHYIFKENEKAIITDYPTKRGYFFSWNFAGSKPYSGGGADPNYLIAFHPSSPTQMAFTSENVSPEEAKIDGFPSDIDSKFTEDKTWLASNDPCPYGYETPTMDMVRSSLYQNFSATAPGPLNNFGTAKIQPDDNFAWGYYADGFFDRRPTRSAAFLGGSHYYLTYTSTGYNSDVANVGIIFFNPNNRNNNSVFFPAGGSRISTQGGGLLNVGANAYYHLSTVLLVPLRTNFQHQLMAGGSQMLYKEPLPKFNDYNRKIDAYVDAGQNSSATDGLSMRCVRKETQNNPEDVVSIVRYVLSGGTLASGAINDPVVIKRKDSPTITLLSGSDVTPPAGKTTLKSWNTKSNGTGTSLAPGSSYTASEGVLVIYAQFE